MAGIRGSITTAEVALAASTKKTVLQLTAPANQRLILKRWGIFFDGVDPLAAPVEVELLFQTTAGTLSSLTPVKLTPGSETVQATAGYNATAEPTAGDLVEAAEVHPQSGYEVIMPLGEEIIIPGGSRIGITALAGATVNARAKMLFEE